MKKHLFVSCLAVGICLVFVLSACLVCAAPAEEKATEEKAATVNQPKTIPIEDFIDGLYIKYKKDGRAVVVYGQDAKASEFEVAKYLLEFKIDASDMIIRCWNSINYAEDPSQLEYYISMKLLAGKTVTLKDDRGNTVSKTPISFTFTHGGKFTLVELPNEINRYLKYYCGAKKYKATGKIKSIGALTGEKNKIEEIRYGIEIRDVAEISE